MLRGGGRGETGNKGEKATPRLWREKESHFHFCKREKKERRGYENTREGKGERVKAYFVTATPEKEKERGPPWSNKERPLKAEVFSISVEPDLGHLETEFNTEQKQEGEVLVVLLKFMP